MNYLVILQEEAGVSFETVNTFIGHIIWPLTVLVVFLLFRKQITKKMDRLNSIDATATGVSMTFDQEVDEAIEEMIEDEEPKLLSKSGVKIGEEAKPKTPVAMILSMRDEMNQKIVKKATSVGIDTKGKSSDDLLDELEAKKEITSKEHKNWSRLIHLTQKVDQSITKTQVNKVRLLFNNYNKEL